MLGVKEELVDVIAYPALQSEFPIIPTMAGGALFPSFSKIVSVLLHWSRDPPANFLGSSMWEPKPEAFIFPGSALCSTAGGTYVM